MCRSIWIAGKGTTGVGERGYLDPKGSSAFGNIIRAAELRIAVWDVAGTIGNRWRAYNNWVYAGAINAEIVSAQVAVITAAIIRTFLLFTPARKALRAVANVGLAGITGRRAYAAAVAFNLEIADFVNIAFVEATFGWI